MWKNIGYRNDVFVLLNASGIVFLIFFHSARESYIQNECVVIMLLDIDKSLFKIAENKKI